MLGAVVACAALLSGGEARSDGSADTTAPVQSLYGKQIPVNQIEFLSTPDRIMSVASSGAPTAIWETLEHGERVECLQCIPAVEPLLYDNNAKTREIAAWWLRRRVFGIWESGAVYERTLNTLKSDADPTKRAYAAYALGEFLATPGIAACAAAVTSDSSPRVRAAAASALGRLNDDGGGALSKAFGDPDTGVKLAAIASAGRINTFSDVVGAARLLGDGDAKVRRRAVALLDTMRATDSMQSLLTLAQSDPDVDVRIAACHALGIVGNASIKPALQGISQNDANGLVRDTARIALLRL
jgi:HEAT repeat protein